MRKIYLVFYLLVLIFFAVGYGNAQDFTITVGQDITFTQFNVHETLFENCSTDPTGGLCAQDPDIPIDQNATSQDNKAAVWVVAQPNSNGRAYARIGVLPNFNFGSYDPNTVGELPVKITFNFDYTLNAEYYLGSSDGEIRINPFFSNTEPWYDIIGHVAGSSGLRSMNNVTETYDTKLSTLFGGFGFLIRCHAHTGDNSSVTPSTGSANVTIHSINIEFDHSNEKLDAHIDFDPDTLNLKSNGKYVTCFIELPENYKIEDINLETVILNLNDFFIPAEIYTAEIGDYNANSISDLMVKFDRQSVQEVCNTGATEMILRFQTYDGTLFEGKDTVLVIDKGQEHYSGDQSSVVY